MPPKKKSGKGKKSGKKKIGKKSATSKEPKMTVEEAILAFQIEIKDKSMQDLLYDSLALKERKERLKQRNNKLKEEQLSHIKTLLKQVKEKDKEVEQAVEVGHDQVEKALLEKFEVMKREEQDLQEHQSRIESKEDEIREVRREIKRQEEYKDHGQHESAKQIKLLQLELQDMEDSHCDIAAHLDRSLNIAKDEIETFTESTISKQKDSASEKVANSLDKDTCAEIMDNKWLKKEVAIHHEAHAELNNTVEELEKRNLDIMTELFDCKVEDLKFTKKFYLTCVEDADSDVDGEEDEEVLAEHGEVSDQQEKPVDLLDNYYFLPGDDMEESPRLGAMELQMLSIVGTQKPILGHPTDIEGNELVPISPIEGPSTGLRPEHYGNPSHWPVTSNMLQTLTTH